MWLVLMCRQSTVPSFLSPLIQLTVKQLLVTNCDKSPGNCNKLDNQHEAKQVLLSHLQTQTET